MVKGSFPELGTMGGPFLNCGRLLVCGPPNASAMIEAAAAGSGNDNSRLRVASPTNG